MLCPFIAFCFETDIYGLYLAFQCFAFNHFEHWEKNDESNKDNDDTYNDVGADFSPPAGNDVVAKIIAEKEQDVVVVDEDDVHVVTIQDDSSEDLNLDLKMINVSNHEEENVEKEVYLANEEFGESDLRALAEINLYNPDQYPRASNAEIKNVFIEGEGSSRRQVSRMVDPLLPSGSPLSRAKPQKTKTILP
ncbi:hypothetical protein L1987_32543 [Smallanthus sonchifolius]|uniref:Uncharacterized protein n=1 Tax=Smallanthus sonchifolius TaxID=185202 RepID=A0ACB9HNB0_9ASTR|nr:hypothetical protein L1987_32543 [Smallanthus sonchifolius]